jgi:hypothetical protein
MKCDTVAESKGQKRQKTMADKTLHTELKIEQHEFL